MLILTRRVGETVMIGNDVTVTVRGVKGNQVRIGVGAPKTVAVHREEIWERIRRQQAASNVVLHRSPSTPGSDRPHGKCQAIGLAESAEWRNTRAAAPPPMFETRLV